MGIEFMKMFVKKSYFRLLRYLKRFIHSNREVYLNEEFVLAFMYVFMSILGGKHLAKSDLL